MRDFADKVVLITGAGLGIGRATARAFFAAGATVHAVDISAERLHELAAELDGIRTHRVDCTQEQAIAELAESVYERDGRLDVLHNNAGIGHAAPIERITLEDWRRVLDVNLWSVIYGLHVFVPRMIAQGGGGHIVNTASGAGLIGLPGMAAYCASKFAVVGISESIAAELESKGIFVTALCPGIISTNIVRSAKIEVSGDSTGGGQETIARFYDRFGTSPDVVAADVLDAVRRKRGVQVSPAHVYPPWLLKRTSVALYQWVSQKMQGFITRQFHG